MNAMGAAAAEGRLARWRNVLLAVLGLVVAALVGLYYVGRQATPPAEAPAGTETSSARVDELADTVAASDAFDFTQTIEGRPVFSLHGDRFQANREGVVDLEGVRLRLYREGQEYVVASERARYDGNSQEATLTGGVDLQGTDRFALRAPRLQMLRGGKVVRADGPVAFRLGDAWTGGAGSLEIDVGTDRFTLSGEVSVEGTPRAGTAAVALRAPRLILDRPGRVLRAPDGAKIAQGASWLESRDWELFLAADGETPQLLRLDRGVGGSLAEGGVEGAGRSELRATDARLEFDIATGRPARLMLLGAPRSPARMDTATDAGTVQGLASLELEVQFREGQPASLASSKTSYFAEYVEGVEKPIRSGRADSFAADLADAELIRVVLTGGVTLTDPQFRGWGERALIDLETGRAELLGEPARLETDRGELAAPHLIHSRATGLLTAADGVRALLRRDVAAALSGMGWRGEQPVQVQAKEGVLQERPRGFVFRGDVRAWQGSDFLLADQLRGQEEGRVLTASGAVKTMLSPDETADKSAAQPIEVSAGNLTYREAEGEIVYAGGVQAVQSGRVLSCDELTVVLHSDRRLKSMAAAGKVLLRETASGRVVQATRADYDLAAGTIDFVGEPVTLNDPQGARMTGHRLRYDLATSAARMTGSGA